MLDIYSLPEYWFFIGKFIFANLFLPMLLFMFMSKILHNKTGLSHKVLLILALGITPGLVSLILYYLLFLFPGISPGAVFTIVTFVFVALGVYGFNESKTFFRTIGESFASLWRLFKGVKGKIVLWGAILFLALTFIYLNYYLMSKKLTEHDTLEYTIQGDIFYRDMKIGYEAHRYDEASGFYYVGLHGFTFPLIKTWENTMNQVMGFSGDHYFKVTNMFYGTLLLFLIFIYLYRYNAFLALIGFVATFLTYGFFETYMKYHIDNMRVFYLVCAFILLYECVRQPSMPHILLFAILMGLQANSHSLGALISVLELGTFFFFIPVNWGKKFMYSALTVFLLLVFGGIHYVLDVAIGTGWIFQDIKFY